METKPIFLSDNYRSGFLMRIKKTDGKVNNVWLEISSHNSNLETTMVELGKLVKDMKLEQQIGMQVNPPHSPQPPKEPEKLNVRYFCVKCSYSFPAFPSSPNNMSYYCPTCQRWGNFQKR